MTTDITRYETAELAAPVVTSEQLDIVRKTIAQDATPAELQLFLYDCARQGVHPLDRLLHFTKRKGKYTPITSIDLLRSRAGDTGELAGIDDAVYQGEPKRDGFQATVTVWRLVQGQRCPFTATARWSEYLPSEAFMWQKMPHLMLGKVAEALALRKAFPRQLSGVYAKEEMEQAGTVDTQTGEIVNHKPQPNRRAAILTRLTALAREAHEAGINVQALDVLEDTEVLAECDEQTLIGIGTTARGELDKKKAARERASGTRLDSIESEYDAIDAAQVAP